MKDVSPFQFFRYLIPGAISILFFVVLVLIDSKTPKNPILDWPFFQIKPEQVNGLGAGILVIVFASIWGFFCNILYQILSKFLNLDMDHRSILKTLVDHGMIQIRKWNSEKLDVDDTIITNPENQLSKEGAWSIFDSEYYKRRPIGENTKKAVVLMRHEGLFDYFHGTGTTFIGCLIFLIIWLYNNKLDCCDRTIVIFFSLLLLVLLARNYWILRSICKTHIEGSFFRLFGTESNLISKDGEQVENATLNTQVIFVGPDHLKQ